MSVAFHDSRKTFTLLIDLLKMLLPSHKLGLFPSVSFSTSVLLLLIICLFLLQWRNEIRDYLNRRSVMMKFAEELPGPPTLPIVGNALELMESDRTVYILTEISRQVRAATYRFWMGPSLKLIVADPRDLEIMLLSSKASKKDDFYELMHLAVRDGLINSFGPTYRAHKKLFLNFINNNFLMKIYIEHFNKQSRIFVERLETQVNQPEFNMQDFFEHCIGDIVFETIYGLPGTAQRGQVSPFFELADVALHITFERFMKPWLWPDFMFFLTPSGRKCRRIVKEAHAFIDNEVKKKREKFRALNRDVRDDSWSIFDLIIDHVESTNEWTNEEIRDEIITVYIGAHDTLVGTGCFVLLMLAMHPDVQEKAREEINNIVGNHDVTETEIGKLKYLEMIIRETIRLFPVGAVIGRKTTGELKLATCTVPKDCSLFVLLYALHRDPKYWMNPEKFDPDRFSPENSRNRHPYAFIPFSGGSRSCPGNKFALTCLKVILSHTLRNFRLQTTQNLETLRVHTHISSRSLEGYQVSLTKI
ncbi:cytochrome P450 4C1 [Diachasma alloeum]|uniref:cytochrome P450 4C1 n=1 Tax=Diachasma alloeum TaxID=454923 RepID=UPI00073830FE|nr:cytochrome P450 4C1 [Diachasma alloeum]